MQVFLSDAAPSIRPQRPIGRLLTALTRLLTAAALTAATAPTPAAAAALAATPHLATLPTLDSLPDALITSFPLTVSGTAQPGDVIDVSGGSSANPEMNCTASASTDGRFHCPIRHLPDGPGIAIRAESRSTGHTDSGRVDVLSPPTITSPHDGATSGGIHGTGYPLATVTVTAETGNSCSFPVDNDGVWSCVIPGLRDGKHTVTATEVAPFSSTRSMQSSATIVVVDTVQPAAPTLVSPAPDASTTVGTAVTFNGSGEADALVTVYVSTTHGVSVACRATVSGSAWSCTKALTAGRYTASALQRDSAGNISSGSNSITLTVKATTATSPSPSPPSGSTRPHHQNTTSEAMTPFSTVSAPVGTAASLPGWLRSIGLAGATFLLLIAPGRLLATARSRSREARARRASLFGRNRARSNLDEEEHDLLGSQHATAQAETQLLWLAPAATITAAALVTLPSPVQDAAASLWLLLAVTLALIGINASWVLAAHHVTRRRGQPRIGVVVRPALLVIVAATALGSLFVGLEPALLFGIVLGTVPPKGFGQAEHGRTAAAQLSVVATLGTLAWFTIGTLPAPTDEVSTFFVELTKAIALLAIGSTAIALLPFGSLAGRAVFRWSRPLWLTMGLVVYTALFALLLPVTAPVQMGAGVVVIVVVVLMFAVASLSAWLWQRYVEPTR